MIKVTELSGATLAYWVERANGTPADDLQVKQLEPGYAPLLYERGHIGPLPHSIWHDAGPLVDKYRPMTGPGMDGTAWAQVGTSAFIYGATYMEAICRAIVLHKFGPEVEDVAGAE